MAEAADSPEDAAFIRVHKPIFSEDGLASWYGPPYDKRRGANGEIYDENALTAAQKRGLAIFRANHLVPRLEQGTLVKEPKNSAVFHQEDLHDRAVLN